VQQSKATFPEAEQLKHIPRLSPEQYLFHNPISSSISYCADKKNTAVYANVRNKWRKEETKNKDRRIKGNERFGVHIFHKCVHCDVSSVNDLQIHLIRINIVTELKIPGSLLSSGMWLPVMWYIFTVVSEERAISSCFPPEDGGSTFLRDVGKHLPDYTASLRRRQEPQTSINVPVYLCKPNLSLQCVQVS
jgi:hypothetical protein